MKKNNIKIIVYFISIIAVVGMILFTRQNIYKIADVFIEIEMCDSQAIVKLINENWEGITTYTDEQKKNLVANLGSEHAALGVESMRTICLALVNIMGIISVFILSARIFQLYRENRSNKAN